MLIPGIGQWPWRCLFCLFRLSIRSLCITTTKSHFNFLTYTTKNCWRSVDSHFQDGVTNICCTVVHEKATNISYMNYWQRVPRREPRMASQTWFTLYQRSFAEWGSDRVAVAFAYKHFQFFGYAYQGPIHFSITLHTIPKIVDTLLTLIIMNDLDTTCYDEKLYAYWFDLIGCISARLRLGPVAMPSPMKFSHGLLTYYKNLNTLLNNPFRQLYFCITMTIHMQLLTILP